MLAKPDSEIMEAYARIRMNDSAFARKITHTKANESGFPVNGEDLERALKHGSWVLAPERKPPETPNLYYKTPIQAGSQTIFLVCELTWLESYQRWEIVSTSLASS